MPRCLRSITMRPWPARPGPGSAWRTLLRPHERWWLGGYAAAMTSIIALIDGMAVTTQNPARVLAAVYDTAAGVCELHYRDTPDECWPDAADGGQP